MKVTTEHNVENCSQCPYANNEAREWDDPFTSPPSSPAWWCTNKKRKGGKYLAGYVHREIDDNCPLKGAAG